MPKLSRTIAFAITVLSASSLLYAQATPVAQPVPSRGGGTPVAVSPSLTTDQRVDLFGRTGVRPGAYRLMARGGCMRVEQFVAAPQVPYIYREYRSGECTQTDSIFYLIPYPGEKSFTVRNIVKATGPKQPTAVAKRMAYCATVARNVVFGAPRIDYLTCDANDDGRGWNRAGANDQRFWLEMTQSGKNSHRIAAVNGDDRNCWTFADDLVSRACTNMPYDPDQQIQLVPVQGGWPAGYEEDALRAQGWALAPDGLRRSVAVGAVDIPGNDMSASVSIGDSGQDCQKRCVADTGCHAWTWTRSGFNGNPKAMCFHKHKVGTPVNLGPANALSIFSGIVRP